MDLRDYRGITRIYIVSRGLVSPKVDCTSGRLTWIYMDLCEFNWIYKDFLVLDLHGFI